MRYLTVRQTPLRRALAPDEDARQLARQLARQARRQHYRGTLHIDLTTEEGQKVKRYRLRAGGERPVYARPQATAGKGVGLVCIRDVPEGTAICSCSNVDQYRQVSSEDFERLHESEKTFYHELFDPKNTDGTYFLPSNPEVLEMACFVNHSSAPSCRFDATRHAFVAKRPLRAGDEVTVDYGQYLEPHKFNRKYVA